MSETSRLANLEASAQAAADYLDELRSTLADHGAALGALRMRELEQRLAPSLAGPGVPTAPRVVMGGDVSVAGSLGTSAASFGNGADGTVTISSDTNLTVDKYYANLTVNAGKRLSTNGCRVFVSGVLTNNGYISNNGAKGENVNQGPTPAGGAGGIAGFLGGGSAGGLGGLWTGNSNGTGGNGVAISASLGGTGGIGGANPPYGYGGGNGGVVTVPTSAQGTLNDWGTAARGCLSDGTTKVQGGSGGGGGAGLWNYEYGAGGGGGGGVVFVAARIIDNANGVIEANGGAGGDNTYDYNPPYAATGAGGGGGVVIVASTAAPGGTVRALGGTHGTNTHYGTSEGADGSAGTVVSVVI